MVHRGGAYRVDNCGWTWSCSLRDYDRMSEFQVASRMQRHDLHKLHALGNDFLLWFRPNEPDDLESTAQRWCHRTTGIGADGLIVVIDDRVAPRFVLYNSDGGRAEVSGNGLRCFGHAIAARRGLDELETIVTTDAGDRHLRVSSALETTASVAVGMGAPARGPSLDGIDLSPHLDFERAHTVDVGNPHIVIEVADPERYDMRHIGPLVEAYFMPTGINVHLMTPTPTGVKMAIWERGAGVTEACGSGACAAAAVASLSRPDESSFRIDMPGGVATVEVGDELTLVGPSTYIAAVEAVAGP